MPSLQAVLAAAGAAKGSDGKRHPHQRRLSGEVLNRCTRALVACAREIRATRSFAALHSLLSDTIGGIRGVGKLMVYDTADRIGVFLDVRPESVYLHAGVRSGARALGLRTSGSTIAAAGLPAELRRVKPWEAEDILCIYKDSKAFHGYAERRPR